MGVDGEVWPSVLKASCSHHPLFFSLTELSFPKAPWVLSLDSFRLDGSRYFGTAVLKLLGVTGKT